MSATDPNQPPADVTTLCPLSRYDVRLCACPKCVADRANQPPAAALAQERDDLRTALDAANALIGETAEECRRAVAHLTAERDGLAMLLRAAKPWIEEDLQFRQKGGYRVDNLVNLLAQIDAALSSEPSQPWKTEADARLAAMEVVAHDDLAACREALELARPIVKHRLCDGNVPERGCYAALEALEKIEAALTSQKP